MFLLEAIRSFIFPTPLLPEALDNQYDILDPIRERIVTAILRICMLLGIPAVLLSTIPVYEARLWRQLLIGYLSLILIIYLAMKRSIPHQVRSWYLIFGAFMFIVVSIIEGINELTFAALFCFVVMVTLLLGRRGSIFGVTTSLLLILLVRYLLLNEFISHRLDLIFLNGTPLGTVSFFTDWLFFVGIFILATWVYFDGFNLVLSSEREARRAVQEERDRLVQSLAREKKLIRELELSYKQVSQLSSLKSKMITAVSHEFRTPLTVIKSSSELLTTYLDRLKPEKRQAVQNRIDDSVHVINQLLHDIEYMDFGNRQNIQVAHQQMTIKAFLKRAEGELLQRFPKANLIFRNRVNDDTAVSIDYGQTLRILSHLISNAIKFSESEEPVEIIIEKDDRLSISVKDFGIGLQEDEIEHIWEPFYRVEHRQEFAGLGLGLSIVSLLVDVLDGEIVASSPGYEEGSTFTIYLPLDLDEDEEASQ